MGFWTASLLGGWEFGGWEVWKLGRLEVGEFGSRDVEDFWDSAEGGLHLVFALFSAHFQILVSCLKLVVCSLKSNV